MGKCVKRQNTRHCANPTQLAAWERGKSGFDTPPGDGYPLDSSLNSLKAQHTGFVGSRSLRVSPVPPWCPLPCPGACVVPFPNIFPRGTTLSARLVATLVACGACLARERLDHLSRCPRCHRFSFLRHCGLPPTLPRQPLSRSPPCVLGHTARCRRGAILCFFFRYSSAGFCALSCPSYGHCSRTWRLSCS